MSENISSIFGELVFDDREMKKRLSEENYTSLKTIITTGGKLSTALAYDVAKAMRDWALEKGATHYAHWFQPMSGMSAGKHEGFLVPDGTGSIIMDFSGKDLIQGEPDASSFPSGGLRQTFEARGYTIWDASSYAFIKENTLYIPTCFISYTGEALDKKTPLLRSMQALNTACLRILKLFHHDEVKRVIASVGAEQEYFLIDKDQFMKRHDLLYTNRTLFGARPAKGDELSDHYFGIINPRVKEFMADLDNELWRLGISAKTEHNESAPLQYELASLYNNASIEADHNQLVMEMMQKVAVRHNMVCVLHEKPFLGVNGSGKHNNWSLTTDTNVNLLSPGETPNENAQFLLFLTAVIRAVDEYQDLLRLAIASPSNDLRLGAKEAPPAVISMFLGDELTNIFEAIEQDADYKGTSKKKSIRLGIDSLPKLTMDSTDRNRTSPFAFTGNKFEFRMLGSSNSISCANIMLNSAVTTVLNDFADTLEKAGNFEDALHQLIKDTYSAHKRIIFNGNGYDEAWMKEAEKRGLSNYPTVPDCMPHIADEKNVAMLSKIGVLSETEIKSRMEIYLDIYRKTKEIEARTMISMASKEIVPAIVHYEKDLAKTLLNITHFTLLSGTKMQGRLLKQLTDDNEAILAKIEELSTTLAIAESIKTSYEASVYIRDFVLPAMDELRKVCDHAETITSKEYWPFPTYGDLFFGLN